MSLEVAYAPPPVLQDLTPRPRSAPPPPVDTVPMMLGLTSFTKTAAAMTINAALRALSLSPRPLTLWRTSPAIDAYTLNPVGTRLSFDCDDQPTECASVNELARDAENAIELDLHPLLLHHLHLYRPCPLNPSTAVACVAEPSPKKTRPVKTVKFATYLGQVRFFKHTEKPQDVSLARWTYIDEPASCQVEYTVTLPNWSTIGMHHSPFYASPNIYTLCLMDATELWDTPPNLTYNACPAAPVRTPCPWDTVIGETVQVIVGLNPTPTVKLLGTVVVANVAFTKRVSVRVSTDFWHSFTDVQCTYVSETSQLGFERWRFVLNVPDQVSVVTYLCFHFEYLPGSTLVNPNGSGTVFESVWDNNSGSNYQVDICSRSKCTSFSFL